MKAPLSQNIFSKNFYHFFKINTVKYCYASGKLKIRYGSGY